MVRTSVTYTRPGGSWATFLLLPGSDVICASITKQTKWQKRQNGIYLLISLVMEVYSD